MIDEVIRLYSSFLFPVIHRHLVPAETLPKTNIYRMVES
jgi:hypothetical protein